MDEPRLFMSAIEARTVEITFSAAKDLLLFVIASQNEAVVAELRLLVRVFISRTGNSYVRLEIGVKLRVADFL